MVPQLLSAMDNLLTSAAEEGREPKYWVMPLNNWKVIGDFLGKNMISDPTTVGTSTYRDVPVHFTKDDIFVGLMTSPDDKLLT